MKYFIFTCITLNLVFASRVDRHEQAVKEFSELNFFYKGRGMTITPDLIKFYDVAKKMGIALSDNGLLNKRWGLNLKDKEIKGMFSIPYKQMQAGVLGCVACHSGKAAGEFIVGLGNKTIDVGQIGKDAYMAQMFWGAFPRPNKPEFKQMHERAMHFTKILKNKNINNLTQGLVSTSLVKSWFYEVAGLEIPKKFGRGQVKVPHLWGYGEKRKVGSFWDGFADGVKPGWAVAVEVRAGQSPQNVREYLDKVHHAEDVLGDFLPPKYPFKIDEISAARGKTFFNKTCAKCHGTYERDSKGLPVFKAPKFIPHRVVKTDPERLDFVTDSFIDLIDSSPLNDIMTTTKRKDRRTYVAQRLWGIWSRFPYLHNASVPTLWDLLSPADERPKLFDLYRSGEKDRFDEKKLGLKTKQSKSLYRKAKKGARHIYDTSRMGHSNIGHEFSFYKKITPQIKKDLIEYLKTL